MPFVKITSMGDLVMGLPNKRAKNESYPGSGVLSRSRSVPDSVPFLAFPQAPSTCPPTRQVVFSWK